MEQDSALPAGAVVDSSLRKVRDAYIGIIGHSYGQIPDSDADPQRLSLTELEFRETRHLGRPTPIFIMGEDHPVKKADVEQGPEKIPKLAASRDEVNRAAENSRLYRVYREFNDLHERSDEMWDSLILYNEPSTILLERLVATCDRLDTRPVVFQVDLNPTDVERIHPTLPNLAPIAETVKRKRLLGNAGSVY